MNLKEYIKKSGLGADAGDTIEYMSLGDKTELFFGEKFRFCLSFT